MGRTSNNKSCFNNVDTLTDAILFAFETGSTIGYGTHSITAYCPVMIITWTCYNLIIHIIQTLLCGLIVYKFYKWVDKFNGTTNQKSICIKDDAMHELI